MFRFFRLYHFLAHDPLYYVDDEPLCLLDIGELDDDAYAELVGYTRHGAFHLREGEELERDDGWAGDLDRGVFGGDAAGAGGQYD